MGADTLRDRDTHGAGRATVSGDAVSTHEKSVLDRLELEDMVVRQSAGASRASTWLQVAVVVALLCVFALAFVGP